MKSPIEPFHVVVLSCTDLGIEVANRIWATGVATRVTLLTAPYVRKVPSSRQKLERLVRREGPAGVTRAVMRQAHRLLGMDGAHAPDDRALDTASLDPAIAHHRFADFHAPDCLAVLDGLDPTLGVVAGTYILEQSVFGAPRLGSINLHSGEAPAYRGAAPAFWELYNGEPSVGITIHEVLAKLDAGNVLLAEQFPLERAPAGDPMAYVARYRNEVLRPHGVRMVAECVVQVARGTTNPVPQDHARARTYRSPEYRDVCELRRRVAARRREKEVITSTVTRRVKHLAGLALFRSGLHRLVMPNCAIVALFHRIDAGIGAINPISCTPEKFVAFCDFFQQYCTIITFTELLDKLERGEDLTGHVVITFDDGYRDNRLFAAAELKKRGLPACFFVATGFIASDHVPWWDEEEGIRSQWMSWDQVRELRQLGFEVGSHTVNHVDLGTVSGAEAQWEIEESKRKLEAELGEATDLFSYPYGRINQCTEENRRRVRDLGFRTCPSACGGVVEPGADPFHLRRIGVSPWYLSPYQFMVETFLSSWKSSVVSSLRHPSSFAP
jgi:peptidoglycan/xylan/chitin deacetylase (PgdA/CDA1 family)/folate-dependent phosphoribosylglycinamide formyltransferase PurN